MSAPISVVIPVGPEPHHRAFLDECLASVAAQTLAPDEVVVVESDLGAAEAWLRTAYPDGLKLVDGPRERTIAEAFNLGVRESANDLVFLLGSDDLIYPRCIERCWQAWQAAPHALGWYFVGVRQSDGYEQNTPCLAAMVTKALWAESGGLHSDFSPYPATEIEFISRMLLAGGKLGATYRVSDDVLYFWRKR